MAFVSETYLKTITPVNNTVDATELSPWIEAAERQFGRELLGTDLYDDIKIKFDAQTLSASETALVLIIKKALAFRTLQISIPFLAIKIRNIGVVIQSTDYAQSALRNDISFLIKSTEDIAEAYERDAILYIKDNIIDYHPI